jgi:hypothetical protein
MPQHPALPVPAAHAHANLRPAVTFVAPATLGTSCGVGRVELS